jgi:cytochrome c oxidase cbb3-type subunit 3
MLTSAMKCGRTLYGMNFLRSALHWSVLLVAPILGVPAVSAAQTQTPSAPARSEVRQSGTVVPKSYPPALIQSGSSLFRQNCSFCHGRDAAGGESGPDLTRSKLVTEDVDGDKIGAVVRNGRADKGMPHFDFSDEQMASLTAEHRAHEKGRTSGGRCLRSPERKRRLRQAILHRCGRVRILPLANRGPCRDRIAL